MNPRGNPATLKPCKPGETHNPHGRPRGSVRGMIRELAKAMATKDKTNAELIAKKLYDIARKGNVKAIEMVVDNVDGKLPQPVSGEIKGIIQILAPEQISKEDEDA